MIHVTCAIIQHEGKVLICKRSARVNLPLSAVAHQDGGFALTLYPFVCALAGSTLHPTEHEQAIWVDRAALMDYDLAAADVPVVREYLMMEYYNSFWKQIKLL